MDVIEFTDRQIVVKKKCCPDKDNLKKYLVEFSQYPEDELDEYDFNNIFETFIRYYPKTPGYFVDEVGDNGCWMECSPQRGAIECWMITPI